MDQLVTEHTKERLETLFNALYLYDHPAFSLIAQPTKIPWLQFIPKQALDTSEQAAHIYGEIHKIAFYLQQKGFGHFNIAKIGNKHPNYHIHLVFRTEQDEQWPEAIWGQNLTQDRSTAQQLKALLADYFQ